MNTERVLNITLNEKGHMYAMAKRRQLYVTYLHDNQHESTMSTDDQIKLLEWTKTKMAS